MELDFDKEIDALLRKARERTEAATAVTDAAHVDADEIAAFAENALPEKIRQTYITHFAGCDRCRKILSQAILLGAEAEQQAASLPVIAAPVETRSPWRQRLFGLQAIAYTMGTLVLLFTGFLGYMVWQNTSERNTEVSQVADRESRSGSSANANPSAANTAANPANVSSNAAKEAVTNSVSTSSAPNSAANSAANTGPTGLAGKNPVAPVVGDEAAKPMAVPEARSEQAPATAAAPPKPNELKEEDSKLSTADTLTQNKVEAKNEAEKRKAAEEFKAMKKDDRREAQLSAKQVQNLPLNGRGVAGVMMDRSEPSDSARSVGGRNFQKKDGVWYDPAYHGQSTINIRRGTDAYKKLDSGLRNIAESLSGTVVAVWKGKAYRIQ